MVLATAGTAVAAVVVVTMLLLVLPVVPETARPVVLGGAASYGLWLGGAAALTAGLPQGIFWGVIRPAAFLLLLFATVSGPGIKRSAGEWLDVALDGILTTSGLFATFWFVLQVQTVTEQHSLPGWAGAWLAVQFIQILPVAGLLNRVLPGQRGPILVNFWTSALVLAGDMLSLVTRDARVGIPFWICSSLVIGALVRRLGASFYENTFDAPHRPRQTRWWQLPIVPCLLYLAVPRAIDAVAIGLGILVFATLCVHMLRNSSRNERLWDSLTTRSRLYADVLRDSKDAILMLSATGQIVYANPAVTTVLGTTPERLTGTELHTWVSHEELARSHATMADFTIGTDASVLREFTFPGDDGVSRCIEWAISQRQEAAGWSMSGRDVTERNRLQAELVTTARTDALTGLLNRAGFLAEADRRMEAVGAAAVLFLDLDGFKQVNDTLGHAQGDAMLIRAGQWLVQAAGDDHVIARLGSDEFALLATGTDPGHVVARAQAVVNAFSGFDPSPGGRPSVSASIGAVVSRTGRGADLLRDADLAMYRAKQQGGSCVVLFEPWMSQRVLERSRLRADLESAIQDGGLVVHLQPVVSLPGGEWTGFEALVRWWVDGRMCPPDEFLPLARETGLIVPMDAWVLDDALRQLAAIPGRALGMAVNVSAQRLADPEFGPAVLAALTHYGIEPERLTLEITEQTAVQDLTRTASRLNELRAEGIRTAIDDFGTGFSSLQYLARLPVDILKIDRKFVGGLGEHGEDDVLVRSMINLAGEMGYEVIAEGVETAEQARLLTTYGCRLAQGYHFSRPLPLPELFPQLPVPAAAAAMPPGQRTSQGAPESTRSR